MSIKIQPGQFDQLHLGAQVWVGFARNYIHLVAQANKGFRQILKIHTLAAAEWIAAITQQRNAQGFNSTFWRTNLSFQFVIPEAERTRV